MTDAPCDSSGRPLQLRTVEWDRLFAPRGVAVVGASETEGSQQRAQYLQIRERLGARGATVVPVHPTRASVLGDPAYPSVAALPDELDVDVAVVLVRDPIPVVEECLARGVGFCIVFSAGFAETGSAEGRAKQQRMVELGSGSMRIIGPNTNMNIFEPWRDDLPGRKLAIITQSGYQGRPITQGQALGIPIQGWATLGNEVDLEWADFVGLYADLPDTGCIATFVEGFNDGRTLALAADHAARRAVPIVCIKVGRSEQGNAMAQAHTGHLTGADAVHDAVFEQFGIIRVDDIDELVEISGLFCHAPAPKARGVGIYALSGGSASHVADLCGMLGVEVPQLAPETIERLGGILPWYLKHDNPVDTGGTFAGTPDGMRILELIAADPAIGVVFAPITGVFPGMSDRLADDLIALHGRGEVPVVCAWTSPVRDDDAYRALCAAGVPIFHSFGAAIRGIAALVDHHEFVAAHRSPFVQHDAPARVVEPSVRSIVDRVGIHHEVDAKRVLAAYGIPTVREAVAVDGESAQVIAREFGGAVALKVLSSAIAHKSDLGLVALGVAVDDVAHTADRLLARANEAAPLAAVDGVVVQAMVDDAVAEVILGVSQQHPFGPTITYGLGGVFTEIFADVRFGVPPFDEAWARRMVLGTKSAPLLLGARGRVHADVDALVAAIMALQDLVVDLGAQIDELDINPLIVRPRGLGVVAVDALMITR